MSESRFSAAQLSQGCHLQVGTLYSKLISSSPSLCHPRRIRQQSNWDDYVIHFVSFRLGSCIIQAKANMVDCQMWHKVSAEQLIKGRKE
eukprot:scaffold4179_cov173-Cylindrotheca_fusiformis.AAC.2